MASSNDAKVLGTYFGVKNLTCRLQSEVRDSIEGKLPRNASRTEIHEFLARRGIDGNDDCSESGDNIRCRVYEITDDSWIKIRYDLNFMLRGSPQVRLSYLTVKVVLEPVADGAPGDRLRVYFGLERATEITEDSIRAGLLKQLPIGSSDSDVSAYLELRAIGAGQGNSVDRHHVEICMRATESMRTPVTGSYHVRMRFSRLDSRLASLTVRKGKTIQSLTEEQEARVTKVLADWRAKSLSTAPIDRMLTAQAVNSFYKLWNQNAPEIVYCESPFQLIILPLIIKRLSVNRAMDWKVLCKNVFNRLAGGFDSEMWMRMEESLWRVVENQVSNGLYPRFGTFNHVGFAMPGKSDLDSMSLLQELRRQMWRLDDSLRSRMHERMTQKLIDRLLQRTGMGKYTQVDDSWLSNQIAAVLIQQCAGRTGLGIEISTRRPNIWWGTWDWHTLLLYHVVRECISDDFFDRNLKNIFSVSLNLQRSAVAYRFFRDICFVCLPPEEMHVDEQLKLHKENGYAVRFSDGYALHSWHGRSPQPKNR